MNNKITYSLIANTLNVAVRKFAVMPADMEVMEQVCQRLVIAFKQFNKKFNEAEFRKMMFN
jgi:hypothetical protein